MSIVTVSEKRRRVYQRKFDHEEAQRLRAEGMSYSELARRFGVTPEVVLRVCDPRTRERMEAQHRRWSTGAACPDCGAQTTRRRKGDDSRCVPCGAKLRAAVDEEAGLARCSRCKEWKPFPEFRRDKRRVGRLGIARACRACDTAARKARRERIKVPCVQCGAPCLPAGEKGPRARDTGLCLACYRNRCR